MLITRSSRIRTRSLHKSHVGLDINSLEELDDSKIRKSVRNFSSFQHKCNSPEDSLDSLEKAETLIRFPAGKFLVQICKKTQASCGVKFASIMSTMSAEWLLTNCTHWVLRLALKWSQSLLKALSILFFVLLDSITSFISWIANKQKEQVGLSPWAFFSSVSKSKFGGQNFIFGQIKRASVPW